MEKLFSLCPTSSPSSGSPGTKPKSGLMVSDACQLGHEIKQLKNSESFFFSTYPANPSRSGSSRAQSDFTFKICSFG
jgi:hypothetical protein